MAWFIPNVLCERNCCPPVQKEGIGATAWLFKVFVCLSQNIKIQSKNKMQLMCMAFPPGNRHSLLAVSWDHCTILHTDHRDCLPNNPKSISVIRDTEPELLLHEKGAVLTRAAWCCSSPHTWLAPWCCSAHGICSHTSDTGSHWAGTSGRCHRRQASEMSSEPGKHSKWLIPANYLFINWDLALQSLTEINNHAKMLSETSGCCWA